MKLRSTAPLMALLILAGCNSNKVQPIDAPQKPSVARACLPFGLSEYSAQQLATADFCTPSGESVTGAFMDEAGIWNVTAHGNRAAFSPLGVETKTTTVSVDTPNHQYRFTLVR
jgi:hypothetical protein